MCDLRLAFYHRIAKHRSCRRFILALALLVASGLSTTAWAQLKPGQKAPQFVSEAAKAGKTFEFDLTKALQTGPVVVYFYPKAFTSGCTIEAQMFAQAIPEFNELKTTVVGVSGDDIETLKKFSEGPCGGKFAVVADKTRQIMKNYDAALTIIPGMADRISYAIAPDGTILEAFESLSPQDHVSRTLKAVKAWRAKQ